MMQPISHRRLRGPALVALLSLFIAGLYAPWVATDPAVAAGRADGFSTSRSFQAMGTDRYTVPSFKNGQIVTQDTASVTIAADASIDADGPYSGPTGTPITFSATVNDLPAGASVRWEFGDGTFGMGAVASHVYTTPGVYALTASIYQGATLLASDSATAVISGGATTIEASGPYGGPAGSLITFSSIVANPPPGYTVLWTFGDGSSAQGNWATHAYMLGGTYAVTATVYQSGVSIATDSSVAVITGRAPAATVEAGGPYSGIVGQPVSFAASVSNQLPGAAVGWAFGDGSNGYGPVINHRYSGAGTYTAVATVYQGAMPVASDSATVAVLPAPPGGARVTYTPGWNLLAAPTGTVIGGSLGPLYTWQSGAGAYATILNGTPLSAGRGYWTYFGVPTTQVLVPTGPRSVQRYLPAGKWVMLGNPGTGPAIVYGADLVYVYDASLGYVATTMLQPGDGAWALSFGGGVVTISSAGP